MGIFSLGWFKSQKQKQLDELKLELEIAQVKSYISNYSEPQEPQTSCLEYDDAPYVNTQWTSTSSTEEFSHISKPYMNIKMVNDTLTIVMLDGSILTKAPATADDFNAARDCRTESCLINIVSSPEVREEKKKAEAEFEKAVAVKKGVDYLSTLDEFEMKHGSLYLKGINRSLPPILVEEFLEVIGKHGNTENDEFQSLKRFFMWCCLNPRAEVAHELYRFLKENSFRITKQGFFVALRNVVTVHGSNELVQFVSNAYNKVKAVWKKRPDDYFVFLQDGQYKMVHKDGLVGPIQIGICESCEGDGFTLDFDGDALECDDCNGEGEYSYNTQIDHGTEIGNLTLLYLDLPNRAENRFTDDWTKTFDIRIGKPVNMPIENCNWSTQDCAAAGLHFTSDQIHYVGCGDTSVLVLINPMKVVGIGQHKGRCYEYLPIMTVAREEATTILHDLEFDTMELDESYAVRELDGLIEKAKEGFAAESKKYDFNLPALSTVDVINIVRSLDEIKQEISKRIITID